MPWDILFFGITLAAIIFARRWKNPDPNAGVGVAGWGTFVWIIYVLTKYG